MPFDGNTYKPEAKVEFTRDEFLEWAKTKNPAERYNSVDIRNCAMGQFVRETGRAEKHGYYVAEGVWTNDSTNYVVDNNVVLAALTSGTFGEVVRKLEPPRRKSFFSRLLGI